MQQRNLRLHLIAIACASTTTIVACHKGDDDFDYGPAGIAVRALEKKLVVNKCDVDAVKELANVERHAGNAKAAAKVLVAYRTSCKSDSELRLEVEVMRDAGDLPGALVAADALVASSKSDPALRTMRGQVHEDMGDLAAAAVDYRQAFALSPLNVDSAPRLAGVLEKMNKPCDAAAAWAQLARYSRDKRAEGESGVHRILASGGCPDFYPKGSAELDAKNSEAGGWFVFPVSVDGHDVDLGVDTAAPFTTLTASTAASLGIKPGSDEMFLHTFVGNVRAQPVRLSTLQIGDVTLKNVDAVVVDELPDGLHGMLGGDFLERVHMEQLRPDDAAVKKAEKSGKPPPSRWRFAAKSEVAVAIAPK